MRWAAVVVVSAALVGAPALAQDAPRAVRSLRADLEALDARITRLEDVAAVERVQRAYGYYVDKFQHYDVADLFADDAVYEIGGRGVFIGKRRVFEYVSSLGASMGPIPGLMFNHQQFQPIVTLGPDGETAEARVQAFVMAVDQWGDVTYENTYVKEDGVWKIARIFAPFDMYAYYDGGWAFAPRPANRPESFGPPPDYPPSAVTLNYPGFSLAPYHYVNPVTGEPASPPNAAAGGTAPMDDFEPLEEWPG